ncbi:3'(2'),5'-bisphosphate nucleotidase CysQ [Marine Group I thaumarchaeote]|uniref:3'(2'),5'-bisphosphate nucleotidase CysQ n=1 Tax=Marine Group I thaumarchaeote TaxID=2511932 RepID=A0A7K4MUR6_9ARCH|nr:MAG: 3'(2'),5'-bisphosphate nucleotidase CysQ [Nitrosopumilus sp. YT1]NMI82399.1 3'(2'),5'-bisphosphate nucleotidase CysQ [Candidatus Nitrosopumilus sp. MTA1]NWJ20572.1 3'(2'),5'-bisphosphate nucleotidase CysQ [Marine Group I thaumarchaeote]NWJ56521.1 3'(2'),5'-bisphosphate nucleotidase CysQ [Marine Group I thaumarchaeote]NWJ83210.1 3'(2'),5'-bisphosphate nucleotidase CysQ [Marine Group I thaumarchaeote]
MKDIPIVDKIPELDIAIKAAREAGNVILEIYQEDFKTSKKNDDSPITDADLKSNEIIKEVLSQTEHAILSEEDKDNQRRLSKDTIWIIDPLDGTSDFIDKTGEFTVMIALIKNKEPVLGVIGWPTEKTFFVAQKGSGAFRYSNDEWKKISVTTLAELSKCRAIGSRHHLSDKEKLFIKKLGIKDFTSIGSSLKVGKISSGEAEVYITTTNKMKEWDSAASYCIISEAGGKMTDMLGNDITYNNKEIFHQNGILVTNGLIHNKIVEEFKKLK